MGQELDCKLRYGRRTLIGKAYLETDHVLFRGEERLKVLLKDLKSVKAADGVLTLDFAGGPAAFELGRAAEKWADRILHPPSRATKLGLKPGLTVRLAGELERDFLAELDELDTAGPRAAADLIFFAAATREDLARIPKLAAGMKPDGSLWIVYPKGATAIREAEVIAAGRDAGLKDVKVASFSSAKTALKFVVPVSRRTTE
jgi:hypothetical protein